MKTKSNTKKKFAKTNEVSQDKFITKLIELMDNLTTEKWEVFYKNLNFNTPVNGLTHKRYRGGNVIMLLLDMIDNKYPLNSYLTFNQIKEAKGMLRKGSHGVPIEFFTTTYKHDDLGTTINETQYKKLTQEECSHYTKRRIMKTYYVFNISQVENYDEFKINLLEQIQDEFSNTVEQDANYDAVIQNLIDNKALKLESILQGRAFYSPSEDRVSIPQVELFKSSKEYYGTVFHELIHWTGHESRLNRPLQGMNDRENYAFEELIAEIGSLIINLNNNELENFQNSIVYLKGWLSHTKKDDNTNCENTLRKAFIEAQKAVSYILY